MKIVKQIIGIDVSKDTLVACYGELTVSQQQIITRSSSFDNSKSGHIALLRWALKSMSTTEVGLWFVMEATGVYYENLAYFLTDHSHNVVVVLPNKTKNYVRTLNMKTKTDSVDAKMLTQYGLERPLQAWEVTSPILRELKSLSREYRTLQELLTRVRNQKHAKDHSYQPLKSTLSRMKQEIKPLRSQIEDVKTEMTDLIKTDSILQERIERICKVKGLGLITVLSVIVETNGFAVIENTKQLASYAGLDVVHKQSGQICGKTAISKKGNKILRKAVFMPAMVACQTNPIYKNMYKRLVDHNKPKLVAITAVARKLLILIYSLWKSGAEYSTNYLSDIQTNSLQNA